MEFIMTFGALIIVFTIGFLVGAKQEQKRLQPKEYVPELEVVEQLQKLAGIIEHDRSIGSKELAEIIEGLEKKKDAAASMFTPDNVAEFLKSDSKMPKEIKEAMLDASKSIVNIDISGAKNMKEVSSIVNPIAEGRVKISLENLKPKKKSNPKQFNGVESDKPFVKTRNKTKIK